MLVVACVANYGNTKVRTLNWIARVIYKNQSKSDIYSKRTLEGITVYVLIIAPMFIILAIYFLEYVR